MNWFLRTIVARGESLRRARLAVRFGLAFGAYCTCFVPILLSVSAPEAALWTAICSAAMLLAPLVVRWRQSIVLGSAVLVGAIAGLFTGTSATLGGLSSPTTPCLAIAPIVALFLLGPRAGMSLSVFVIVVAGTLYGVELTETPLPLMVDPRAVPFLKMAGIVTVVVVVLIFLLQYESAQNSALRTMSRANRRMVEMIGHLEATSAALRRSAAEFDGSYADAAALRDSDDPSSPLNDGAITPTRGLTQQMMTAAGSGRSMIDGVDDSIRGMIDQYKLISLRIGELHQQSGIIADMVRTIDTISNRLDLMALNTGIEAEHAGPFGQNFKLLAADMRRLAEQVLNETARIKQAISQVQRHTTAAINASRAGQILTDQGSAKLDLMSTTFEEIYQLVERVATASKQITSDTVAQLATIYDLVNASLRADGEQG
ncbi:MAG: methyl-accepting chemotaxis protein [Proteobacteria bacterium]|nr:methyl-accepting chemotaxis protein [Pseudomonadota bacterium]